MSQLQLNPLPSFVFLFVCFETMTQVLQAGLKLATVEGGLPVLSFLPLIQRWGCRNVLPCWFMVMEPRIPRMLAKPSTTMHLQPSVGF